MVDHAENQRRGAPTNLDNDAMIEIARVIILSALEFDGVRVSNSEAERWLNALCALAKVKIRLIGGDKMPNNDPLVVSVNDAPVVHDRTEVQLSDGATGDSGETNDGG